MLAFCSEWQATMTDLRSMPVAGIGSPLGFTVDFVFGKGHVTSFDLYSSSGGSLDDMFSSGILSMSNAINCAYPMQVSDGETVGTRIVWLMRSRRHVGWLNQFLKRGQPTKRSVRR